MMFTSLSTLKRRLREFGLERYNQYQNFNNGAGCMRGYRSMWHTLCIRHVIIIPRRLVQILMRELNPGGCEVRHRRKLRQRRHVPVSHGASMVTISLKALVPQSVVALTASIENFMVFRPTN